MSVEYDSANKDSEVSKPVYWLANFTHLARFYALIIFRNSTIFIFIIARINFIIMKFKKLAL